MSTPIGSTPAPQTYIATTVGDIAPPPQLGNERSEAPAAPRAPLSGPAGAGQMSFLAPNLDGVNWEALVMDKSVGASLLVSANAIAEAMILAQAEMRKSARQGWMQDAQMALTLGLQAAQQMIDSAAKNRSSEMLAAGMAIAMSAIQVFSSSVALRKTGQLEPEVQQDSKALQAKQEKLDAKVQTLKEQDLGDIEWGPNGPPADEPAAAPLTPKEQAMEAAESHQGAIRANMKESRDLKLAQINNLTGLSQGLQGLGNAFAKIAAANEKYDAEVLQAMAQAARTMAEFSQSISQQEMDFSNQCRDNIQKALGLMEAVDAATKQFSSNLYS